MTENNKRPGRPWYGHIPFKRISIGVTAQQYTWLRRQTGGISATIRRLVQNAMDAAS